MQEGVSTIYTVSNVRILHRGGGPDYSDLLKNSLAADNGSEICYWGMQFGSLYNGWWSIPDPGYLDPYYLKCFHSPTATPSNSRRIQHASQLNTIDIDPLVPQMNITDWTKCLSIFTFLLNKRKQIN